MAAITAADFEKAFGITGAATPYTAADDRPLFSPGDEVYDLRKLPSDFDTTTAEDYERIKYTVEEILLKIGSNAGATVILDQREDPLNSTDRNPAGSPVSTTKAGWQHTTTPGATQGANTDSSPWFYNLKDENGNKVYGVHQIYLTDLASAKTFVAADVAGRWT